MSNNLSAELDASVHDFEDAHREVELCHTDVAVTEDVYAALESIALSIETSLQQHGLSPQAAAFTHMALESQYRRVGIESETVALESYGGTKSRLEASQEAYADVKTKLQELWKALMAMVHRAWLAVLNFLDTIVGTSSLLEKAAKTTAEQAKQHVSNNTPRNKSIVLSDTFARRLAVGQHLSWDIPRNLGKTTERLHTDGARLTTSLRDSFHSMRDSILHRDPKKLAFMYRAIRETLDAGFENEYEEAGRGVYETAILPGNVRFQISHRRTDGPDNVTTPEGLENITSVIASMQCQFVEVDAGTVTTTMNTMSMHDILATCEQVEKIAQWSQNFKSNLKALNKEAEDAMRATGARVFSVGGAPAVGHNGVSLSFQIVDKDLDSIYRAYAHTAAFMVRPAVMLQKYIVTVARASLYVAQKSLAEYQAGTQAAVVQDPGTELVKA